QPATHARRVRSATFRPALSPMLHQNEPGYSRLRMPPSVGRPVGCNGVASFMFLQDQRRIRPAEAKAQIQRAAEITGTMALDNIIEIAELIRLFKVSGRRHNAVRDRLQTDNALEGSRSGYQVSGIRFCAGDGNVIS